MNLNYIYGHGILSINGKLFAVKPTDNGITCNVGESPRLEIAILKEYDDHISLMSKGVSYLAEIKAPSVKRVIFNAPATVVIWSDGTKTVVKCQPNDVYNEETGLALCIAKKFLGNKSNFNEVFKKWLPTAPKFLIKRTCNGRYAAEGLIGHKTDKPHTDGLLKNDPGYNVETNDGKVWRINLDAEIEYLN